MAGTGLEPNEHILWDGMTLTGPLHVYFIFELRLSIGLDWRIQPSTETHQPEVGLRTWSGHSSERSSAGLGGSGGAWEPSIYDSDLWLHEFRTTVDDRNPAYQKLLKNGSRTCMW